MKLVVVLCLAAAAVAMEPQPRSDSAPATTRQVTMNSILVPIDHNDPNSGTFRMRYLYNEEYMTGPSPPIFLMLGGEWTITPNWLTSGNFVDMARENGGYMVYNEHRYYGESLPFAEHSLENLRFLTADQALADVAYFITQLKSQPRFANSKVVVYGVFYAANLAVWFKQRYPELVEGAVASSAPLQAQADFPEYLEIVDEAIRSEGSQACSNTIRQGILDTVAAMQTTAGRRSLELAYRFCSPLNYDSQLDMGYFSGFITWAFSGLAQYSQPGGAVRAACDNFAINTYGISNMEKVAGFVNWFRGLAPNACWSGLTFDNYVNSFLANTESRAWYYQQCTEVGFFQTAPTSGTVFDPLTALDLDFYVEVCRRAFDEGFDRGYVEQAAGRTNQQFGGRAPNVTDTVNLFGSLSPWSPLGVTDRDLGATAPTYFVPRASHAFDVGAWAATDTIRMTNARQASRRLVRAWINA